MVGIGRAVGLLAITMATSLLSTPSMAARDKEPCVLWIGSTFMQFSAYQAKAPGMRYCSEIPDVGPATIVLDQADTELREMATDIRIIRNAEGSAGDDGLPRLLSDAAIVPQTLDAITETRILPRTYPNGIIELNHTFTSPGQYHAIVIARNDHGQVYVSQFPFSVGQVAERRILMYWSVAAAFTLIGLIVYWRYAGRPKFVSRTRRM